MDNSLSSISNPSSNTTYQSDPSLNLGLPSSNPASSHSPATSSIAGPGTANPGEPVKRRPGRPKGSTKKNLLGGSPQPPKIKRPVGRPRKDGFPAGSVGPTRSRAKREKSTNLSGVGYPTINMYGTPAIAPAFFQIDPNLERDDWANLARSDPDKFLATLLATLAAPNPVSTTGPSVEEAFKSHLVSLAPNNQPIPSLYSILKTFWLPSSPAYFSLTASTSTARTPSEHRFLYWDPQPLVFNGISCPNCSAPLINRGRISTGPVKIYDIEKPFFIIGCEYACKSPQCTAATSAEGRKFASTDSSILRLLPPRLQEEFPARLMFGDTDAGSGPNIWNWKALGVSLSLWNMVQGGLRAGLKKEVLLHLIHSVQYGIPEDIESKEEEEEAEEEDHVETQQPEAGSSTNGLASETTNGSGFADAYSDAWKENTAVADGSGSSNLPKVPVIQASVTTTSTQSSGPPTQPYANYAGYPYSSYAYFPGIVGVGGMVTSPPRATGSTNMPSASPASAANNHSAPGGTDADAQDQGSKRSPRHCCKCGSQECKGKGGRTFCTNACQDCGKLDCKGRNSRRPDKKCSEGWV